MLVGEGHGTHVCAPFLLKHPAAPVFLTDIVYKDLALPSLLVFALVSYSAAEDTLTVCASSPTPTDSVFLLCCSPAWS